MNAQVSDETIQYLDLCLDKSLETLIRTRDLLRMGKIDVVQENIALLRGFLEALAIDLQEAQRPQDG